MNKTEKKKPTDAEINKLLWWIIDPIRAEEFEEQGNYLEDIEEPAFDDNSDRKIYTVQNGSIVVKSCRGKQEHVENKSLRELLWIKLKLQNVQKSYKKIYDKWQKENGDVPYIQTLVIGETDEDTRTTRKTDKYIEAFCSTEKSGLRLLMAEYGMGKSSFCCELRNWASRQEVKDAFCGENRMAFPLVFDLNDYRNGELREFIENRLVSQYHTEIDYGVFVQLCQMGVFYVVLDAWDQMHHIPTAKIYNQNTNVPREDFDQFSEMWKGDGKVLVTCRRSYYQQQLHSKNSAIFRTESIKLYSLNGFGEKDILAYLRTTMSDIDKDWVKSCWNKNRELFERPLNIKLLTKHFSAITKSFTLDKDKVETYHFLDCVLNDWKSGIYSFDVDAALKLLVSHSLLSGPNRSFRKSEYVGDLEKAGLNPDTVMTALRTLDFIDISTRAYVDLMEFKLAAYQEFLWARYALAELDEPENCGDDTLLNKYLLNREVRAWIVSRLHTKYTDKLEKRLNAVKYKKHQDAGYSGSNALTLLRDLSWEDAYRDKIKEIIKNLNFLPLREADLRGMDLTGANFENSDLEGADLSYTTLDYVNFRYANLRGMTMEEYGRLSKCAFFEWEEGPVVACGTESSGGILTFNIRTRSAETYDAYKDIISGITADSAGVYTAWKDGWTSYLGRKKQLKNAYISSGGLESISLGSTSKKIYVGTSADGLVQYDWKRGISRQIVIKNNSDEENAFGAENVHYGEIDGEQYVAYIQDRKHKLVILKLDDEVKRDVGANNEIIYAEIFSTCVLSHLLFGDICFAGNNIVYCVSGRGVYRKKIESVKGNIDEINMIGPNDRVFVSESPVELGWAKDNKVLYLACQDSNKNQAVYRCGYDWLNDTSTKIEPEKIELDWHYKDGDDIEIDSNMGSYYSFCVSNDERYLIFGGDRLAILEYSHDDLLYQLTTKPIMATIKNSGVDYFGSVL